MKKNLIISVGIAALLGLFTGCNDAEYQPIGNMMYIAESVDAVQSVATLTVKGETDLPLKARLAQPASKEVKVVFKVDEEFLAEYNAKNKTSYKVLPDQYLTLPKDEIKIVSGETTSNEYIIKLGDFYPAPAGEEYCVPICIESNDGGYELTETSSRIMYILSPTHRQYVPSFKNATVANLAFSAEGWTAEGWVKFDELTSDVNVFTADDLFTLSVTKVQKDDKDDKDEFVVKVTGKDGRNLESRTRIAAGKWYHLAYAYAFSESKVKVKVGDKEEEKSVLEGRYSLYIDGNEDAFEKVFDNTSYIDPDVKDPVKLPGLKGKKYPINSLTLFSNATAANMAQLKLWSKALDGGALKGGMAGEINAESEGLFGYWKMDKDDISEAAIKDATAGKHDLTVSTVKWSETRVDFSAPNP